MGDFHILVASRARAMVSGLDSYGIVSLSLPPCGVLALRHHCVGLLLQVGRLRLLRQAGVRLPPGGDRGGRLA